MQFTSFLQCHGFPQFVTTLVQSRHLEISGSFRRSFAGGNPTPPPDCSRHLALTSYIRHVATIPSFPATIFRHHSPGPHISLCLLLSCPSSSKLQTTRVLHPCDVLHASHPCHPIFPSLDLSVSLTWHLQLVLPLSLCLWLSRPSSSTLQTTGVWHLCDVLHASRRPYLIFLALHLPAALVLHSHLVVPLETTIHCKTNQKPTC